MIVLYKYFFKYITFSSFLKKSNVGFHVQRAHNFARRQLVLLSVVVSAAGVGKRATEAVRCGFSLCSPPPPERSSYTIRLPAAAAPPPPPFLSQPRKWAFTSFSFFNAVDATSHYILSSFLLPVSVAFTLPCRRAEEDGGGDARRRRRTLRRHRSGVLLLLIFGS